MEWNKRSLLLDVSETDLPQQNTRPLGFKCSFRQANDNSLQFRVSDGFLCLTSHVLQEAWNDILKNAVRDRISLHAMTYDAIGKLLKIRGSFGAISHSRC